MWKKRRSSGSPLCARINYQKHTFRGPSPQKFFAFLRDPPKQRRPECAVSRSNSVCNTSKWSKIGNSQRSGENAGSEKFRRLTICEFWHAKNFRHELSENPEECRRGHHAHADHRILHFDNSSWSILWNSAKLFRAHYRAFRVLKKYTGSSKWYCTRPTPI